MKTYKQHIKTWIKHVTQTYENIYTHMITYIQDGTAQDEQSKYIRMRGPKHLGTL